MSIKRKRYVAIGLALVVVVAIGLSGWMYAGSADARPGNTCDPNNYPGGIDQHPGGHCVPATTTTTQPTTTTIKPPTTTTQSTTTTTTAAATTTTSTTSTTLPPGGTGFSDVEPSYPYYAQIRAMAERHVIDGFTDGSYRPGFPMSRQQFAKMIVLTLDLPVAGTESCPFGDVGTGMDPSDPFFPNAYVAVCAARGIAVGKTPTTFAPYDDISRQQLISMVARAAGLPNPPAGYRPPFSSSQFYPEEHYLNARKAAYAGLLDSLVGVGPGYDFLASSTRGEMATMLYNLQER